MRRPPLEQRDGYMLCCLMQDAEVKCRPALTWFMSSIFTSNFTSPAPINSLLVNQAHLQSIDADRCALVATKEGCGALKQLRRTETFQAIYHTDYL